MVEKAISLMTEAEVLEHIALQRQMREQRHKESVEEKARKGKQKVVKTTLDTAFNDMLKLMMTPLPPQSEETKG